MLPLEHTGEDCDCAGLFALSAGFGAETLRSDFEKKGDSYMAVLTAALADALVEAWSTERTFCPDSIATPIIRPAFGYPCAPDHEDKRLAFKLLDAEQLCGLTLTSSAMIIPAASVCGIYIMHPEAIYFSCNAIGDDQLQLWAAKKQISLAEAKTRTGFL